MALSLGYSTPRAWLRTITSLDYSELLALRNLEPLGYERDDYRHAMAAYHVIGATNGKPPDLQDLMPLFAGGTAEQTGEEICSAMGQFVKQPKP